MSLDHLSPEKLQTFLRAKKRLDLLDSAQECEASLTKFIEGGWRYIDPSPYRDGWHISAIAEHLEAVARGEIRRLIINVPPRSSKSSIVSVAFPAWLWTQSDTGPLSGPHVQVLSASYANSLSIRDSVKCRRLITSPWYQERWKDRFSITSDQNAKQRFDNSAGGYRLATSVGGSLTGEGGSLILVDDPHNATEVESDLVRQGVLDWWDNAMSTRLNDPKNGAYVLVMQRLAHDDLTGHILEKAGDEWCHLMLPMRYESDRHCVTSIGWSDPRVEDGELLAPERFGEPEVDALERALGPYQAAGQLQQRPTPAGGGILKRDYWRLWDEDSAAENGVVAGAFPAMDYIVASLDTAYTTKQEGDYSALTIFGLWRDRNDNPQLMLMSGWAKRLELHGPDVERYPGESDFSYEQRARDAWGLVEHVVHSCNRFRVDVLLVEATAAGHPVEQEIRRLHRHADFSVRLLPAKGDKVARAYMAQAPFADGLIWAPDRKWADEVITQCEHFPKGKHDDLVDAVTQGVRFFRETGMLQRSQDRAAEFAMSALHTSPTRPVYDL